MPLNTAQQEMLPLTHEVLALRAWRMPDMVIYQHTPNEWWLAPLDDTLPLVRINRLGANLLAAMDGKSTVGTLLAMFGTKVCGPNPWETGRWLLERWSVPRYSLCYFGADPPKGDRGAARWDLLLLSIRDRWPANTAFDEEEQLSQFHTHDIASHETHFETVETTVSHLFREPSEALQGQTYGRLLAERLRQLGWWDPPPRVVVEVGAGLGYVARDLAGDLPAGVRRDIRYFFVEIARPFLHSQIARGREAGWTCAGAQGDAEKLPLKDVTVDLLIANENLADMTPVKLTKAEVESGAGDTALHQEALEWIRRVPLSLGTQIEPEFIFNLGPLRFLTEVWRVLKPGGRAILVEFGIEEGFPAPVKLPGHTEYEVQYSHLRQAARWLGFEEKYGPLPQFLGIRPETRVLCTGAAYAIRRFCEAEGRAFAIRAYTEAELKSALGDFMPKLTGHHYHEISDPAWFGLWDFKVLLLEKPRGPVKPQPSVREVKGYRWGGMR